MSSEPLDLDPIRARDDRATVRDGFVDANTNARRDRRALLAEVDRLRANNAALLAEVESLREDLLILHEAALDGGQP